MAVSILLLPPLTNRSTGLKLTTLLLRLSVRDLTGAFDMIGELGR